MNISMKRKAPVRRESRMATGSQIVRMTAGRNPMRVKWDRLGEDEQRELIELTVKTDLLVNGRATGGYNLDQLSKGERARWERLVEQGAGRPNFFQTQRDNAVLGAELAGAEREARKPARRVDWHEPGSVTLTREIAFDWFNDPQPVLSIVDVGILVWLLGQLENATCLTPGGAVEGHGDNLVLCLDSRLGLGERFFSTADGLPGWKENVGHLADNDFITVEKQGPVWKVGRGRRLRAESRAAA